MAVKTNNIYGKIIISNRTIARFVNHVAKDCYGIVEFSPRSFGDRFISLFKFGKAVKGVNVKSIGDRMYIDISIIVKYGVSIKAVVESMKESIKYKVEKFTGMLVGTINVVVVGVKR